MILNDKELYDLCICKGDRLVYPITPESIQPASIDVRLGDTFLKPKKRPTGQCNSFDRPIEYDEFEGTYFIRPREFVLATTMEYVSLPNNLSAFVEGRSSIGRMGLFIQNAGWIDAGFKGNITLELFNASETPIELKPFTRVAQLVFCTMSESCDNPYNGKYQFQKNAVGSRINLDTEVLNKKEVTNND